MPILGKPMLVRQLERILPCRRIDAIVVATSDRPDDDPVAAAAAAAGVGVYRGSLEDVLGRFEGAAKRKEVRHVIRLTGDCPLIDRRIVDAAVELHLNAGSDYAGNVVERTYPDGYDVEVMTIEALARSAAEANLPSDREHVTTYIRRRPGEFKIAHLRQPLDEAELRLTVDTREDFARVAEIFEELLPRHPDFELADVRALLARRPELAVRVPA